MAGQNSQDVLQQTVSGFAQRVSEYADGIAGRLGQPLSGTQLSKDEAVQRWNFSPLGSTQAADAAYHQMVAQGLPPGKALDQVYPMRSMLYRGADVQDAISNARQIAGWAADATGQPAPEEPKQSTLVMQMALQHNAQAAQGALPPPAMPGPALPPMLPQGPPVGLPGPMPVPPPPPIPAMAGGGVVTQPTLALIGEQGPEAVVPLSTPSRPADAMDRGQPTADEINQYIAAAAAQRGIDPGTALAVAFHEGSAAGQPNTRATFPTGSSWWPFQLHYGGPGYEQYGTVAGLGNDFTAKTGWQPGDPRAWQAATDFALDTAVQRGWYPTFYGSVPAGVTARQGLPPLQRSA